MKDLHITVNNKVATYFTRDGNIVCGNSDYRIVFTFDSEWDDYDIKTARFIVDGQYQDVEFTGNIVSVPILRNTNLLKVGVYAGELDATTVAEIPCSLSVLCGDAVAVESSNNTTGSKSNHFITTLSVSAELAQETETVSETALLGLDLEEGNIYQAEETETETEGMNVDVTYEEGESYQAQETETETENIDVEVTTESKVEETTE